MSLLRPVLLRLASALFLFVFVGGEVYAAIGVADTIRFENYTTRDGLLHNSITALYRQDNGYLWIGTGGGLCRFNGRQFDDLSGFAETPEGSVRSIGGNDRGPVWIATTEGLYFYLHDRFEKRLDTDSAVIRVMMVDRGNRAWIDFGDEIRGISLAGERVYPKGENLPNSNVIFFFEDKQGRIWASFRQAGLAVLEPGRGSWRIFTTAEGLPHNNVNNLFETADGQVVAATHAGLATYHENEFEPVSFNNELPSPIVYGGVVDDRGDWWLYCLRGGVLRWDGEKTRIYTTADGLVDNVVKRIVKDASGHLWFLSARGLGYYNGAGMARFKQGNGITSDIITHLIADENGTVWIGTGYGLNRYEPSRLETFLLDGNKRLPPNKSMSRSIFTDRTGDLWFPSLKGLGYLEKGEFRLFTTPDGLPSDEVHTIFQDSNRRIWVGTEAGIALKRGERFEVPAAPIGSQAIFKITEDGRGRLWVMDRDGSLWVNDDPDAEPLAGFRLMRAFNGVIDLQGLRDGLLWVETLGQLYRIDQEVQVVDIKSLIPEGVFSRFLASDGSWWLGNFNSLYRYADNQLTRIRELGDGEDIGVSSIRESSNGDIWLALVDPSSSPVTGLESRGVALYSEGSFTYFSDTLGVLGQSSGWLQEDRFGRMWMFTSQGLSRWDGEEFTHYRVSDGLSGNLPKSLSFSNRREVWVGTNGGVNKIVDDPAFPKGLVATLPRDVGILNDQISDLALDERGFLWIRTAEGVQRYQPDKNLPRVELASWRHGDTTLPIESGMILQPRQNNLYFRLSGIHLGRGASRLQFAYRLIGEDSAVSGVTRESELHFPNLSSGNYQLRIRAYNADLFTQNLPLSFSFTITEPLWRRPWFILSSIFFGLVLYYLVYRFRIRQKLEKARVFNELQTARRMQLGLMPTSEPELEHFEFYGLCVPAREVGGDYYDYFWLDEAHRHLGLTIMDVSGKSMEAAIISVLASGLVYSEIGSNHTPGNILSKINYPLYKKTAKKIFTTGLLADLSVHDRTLTLANAGHMDPILIRDGKHVTPELTDSRDLPLGVKRQWTYRERTWVLQPGDFVLLYTDGLSEAHNEDNVFFGEERIIDYLEQHHEAKVSLLIHGLLDVIEAFAGSAPQNDDITVIAFRVRS